MITDGGPTLDPKCLEHADEQTIEEWRRMLAPGMYAIEEWFKLPFWKRWFLDKEKFQREKIVEYEVRLVFTPEQYDGIVWALRRAVDYLTPPAKAEIEKILADNDMKYDDRGHLVSTLREDPTSLVK